MRSNIETASADEGNVIAEDCVIRFARISIDNVRITYQSDAERKSELLLRGLRLGQGERWSSNACLANSLLQLLLCHHILTVPNLTGEFSKRHWRRDACPAARSFLCSHPNELLHPVQRDHTNSIVQGVFAEEHTQSFLEHYRHTTSKKKANTYCKTQKP